MMVSSFEMTDFTLQVVAISSSLSDLGVLLVAALCGLIPLGLVLWSYQFAGKAMQGAAGKLRDLRNRTGKFAQRQAMNSKAGQAMKGGWQQYKQKQFLEGKGLQAKLLKGGSRFLPKGARGAITEQMASAAEKLREQRLSTTTTEIARNGGSPLSAHLARMNSDESVAAYTARRRGELMQPGESAASYTERAKREGLFDGFNSDQENALEGLRRRYSTRIGSADFRMSALMAAHATGSDYGDVEKATEDTANALLQESGSIFAANNVMIETIAKSAKANGFQGVSYAGFDSQGKFSPVAIKLGGKPATDANVAEAARSVLGSISLEAMEKGQLMKSERQADGSIKLVPNVLGTALLQDAQGAGKTGPEKDQLIKLTAQKIGQALRNPKVKHRDELLRVANDAGEAFAAEVNRVFQGESRGGGGTPGIPPSSSAPPSSGGTATGTGGLRIGDLGGTGTSRTSSPPSSATPSSGGATRTPAPAGPSAPGGGGTPSTPPASSAPASTPPFGGGIPTESTSPPSNPTSGRPPEPETGTTPPGDSSPGSESDPWPISWLPPDDDTRPGPES